MTKRLMKTRKDHRQARAGFEENTVAQTMTPAAGALAGGVIGTPRAATTFALSAPVGSSRFSVSAGALPAGLSLNAKTGALSGTPTGPAATANFSIRGTDAFGNSKVNAYTLPITAS